MLSDSWGIGKFDITSRINESVRQFNATLVGNPPFTLVSSGNKIQMMLSDLYGSSSPGFFKGRIERLKKTIKPGEISYTISGRDNGLFLLKQPINFPCYLISSGIKRDRDLTTILARILKGTGTDYGPEWEQLETSFSNDKTEDNWYCGEFASKKNAIDVLLRRYLQLNGLRDDEYRWYLDVYGVVRVYNYYSSNKPQITFNQYKKEIEDLNFEDNAEQIENDITYIAGENNSITERLFDSESMQKYGRRVGSPVQKTYITSASELKTYAQNDLNRKSKPIYVGSVTLAGFPQAESGLGIDFPFDPDFGDKKFTITGVQHSGTPGSYLTKIDFSTDENLVLNPSITDLIVQIVQATTTNLFPVVAEVQDINTETGEVAVKPLGELPESILRQQVTVTAGSGNLIAKRL